MAPLRRFSQSRQTFRKKVGEKKKVPVAEPVKELEIKCPVLKYHGANYFRIRVVLATIFRKPIIIDNIRIDDNAPGLQKYEASLLRLIDKVSDGADFNIDVTGTCLRYVPGIITGGDDLTHDCGDQRNIAYFLEALMFLAPFGKQPLAIKLKGITHGNSIKDAPDPSVDHFRTVVVPLMSRIGIEGVTLSVTKKSMAPLGDGEVFFCCPIIQRIKPFKLIEEGRVKRIRGTAFVSKMSPQFLVRLIDKCRGVLNDFLPDVWIYTTTARTNIDGAALGYGVTLVAETMKGLFKAVDVIVCNTNKREIQQYICHVDEKQSHTAETNIVELIKEQKSNNTLAEGNTEINLSELMESEFVGRMAAQRLLLEIKHGGITDSSYQHISLLFMAVAEESQLCQVFLGALTPYCKQFLRHLKDFAGITFTFERLLPSNSKTSKQPNADSEEEEQEEEEEDSIDESDINTMTKDIPQYIAKCVGMNFRNVGRKTL